MSDYILALNCGSSSLKYQIYNENSIPVISGLVEKIGLPDSSITQKDLINKTKTTDVIKMGNHDAALGTVLKHLEYANIDIKNISAIGHRVVLGGPDIKSSMAIDGKVKSAIGKYSKFAPLHNPAALSAINAAEKQMPNALNVAGFDTAFFSTMPADAYTYAIPYAWTEKYDIRRFGYHGLSHLYVSKQAASMLGKEPRDCNLVTLHIGSGASIAAIQNGIAIDTSMGLTPTEGLVMGTRCGNIGPGAVLYLMQVLGCSADELLTKLTKESGLLGLTGKYSDLRDVENNRLTDSKCKLAMDVYTKRIRKLLGSAIASIDNRVDAIVFTAGGGENDDYIREESCKNMEHLGLKMDMNKNKDCLARKGAGNTILSTPDSQVKIMMIPTDEERVLFTDTVAIRNGTYNPNHLEMDYLSKTR